MKTILRFLLWLTILSGVSIGAWALLIKLLHKTRGDLPWWLLAAQLVAIIIFAAGLSRRKDKRWAEPWWGYGYIRDRCDKTVFRAGWVHRLHPDKFFRERRL